MAVKGISDFLKLRTTTLIAMVDLALVVKLWEEGIKEGQADIIVHVKNHKTFRVQKMESYLIDNPKN